MPPAIRERGTVQKMGHDYTKFSDNKPKRRDHTVEKQRTIDNDYGIGTIQAQSNNFQTRTKSVVPTRIKDMDANNARFQDLLQKKYQTKTSNANPMGLVMGPSANKQNDIVLPDLSGALSGLVTQSPHKKDGISDKSQALINKYRQDGQKYK